MRQQASVRRGWQLRLLSLHVSWEVPWFRPFRRTTDTAAASAAFHAWFVRFCFLFAVSSDAFEAVGRVEACACAIAVRVAIAMAVAREDDLTRA